MRGLDGPTRPAAGAATGRIRDGAGHPPAGVQLTSAGGFREPIGTDPNGRFRVEGMEPGRRLSLLVRNAGEEPGRKYVTVEADDRPAGVAGARVDLGDLTAK